MLRNKRTDKLKAYSLTSLIALLFIVQSGCGGGDQSDEIGLLDVPIAYIKRPTPLDDQGDIVRDDLRVPVNFNEGADVYLQNRATATSPVRNITRRITNGRGDVRGLTTSYDGNKLLFALRLEDLTPNDGVNPSWDLYEYNISTDTLSQLTQTSDPNSGVELFEDDIAPTYLPDGNIIFASSRQVNAKEIRSNELGGTKGGYTATDENHRNVTFNLHHLDRSNNNTISQLTFNESHDLDPTVLQNGRVLFTRWNHKNGKNDVSLFSMNPDGTDIKAYYGTHSHFTGPNNSNVHFSQPREMDDGRILAILRPIDTDFGGGDLVLIDGENFAENTQPIWSQQGMVTGPAQTVIKQSQSNGNGIQLQGYYNAVFPMLDGSGRYLMSWSECKILDAQNRPLPCTLASSSQLNDPDTELVPNYGIYLVDANSQTPLVKPEPNIIFSEIVMAYDQREPNANPITSVTKDAGLASQGYGVLHIRSVYDFDGTLGTYNTTTNTGISALTPASFGNETDPFVDTTDTDYGNPDNTVVDLPLEIANPNNFTADERPARFIRILKSSYIPNQNDTPLVNDAFGITTANGMREIVGHAPIEPDGSVKIKVPANVPLSLSILDKDGNRISNRHRYWFEVKPGETMECNGCHIHEAGAANESNNKPHGRMDPDYSLNQGVAFGGIGIRNSKPDLWGSAGDTMAEIRAALNPCPLSNPGCDAMQTTVDLVYDDLWTDDTAANRSADASFRIDYSNLPPEITSQPASLNCGGSNPHLCRVSINYVDHIQPLWETTTNRPSGSCVSCHNSFNDDPADPGTRAHINAGQLDLGKTNPPPDPQLNIIDNPNFYTSYRELLLQDNEQDTDGSEFTTQEFQDTDPPVDADNDGIIDQELVTIVDPDAEIKQPSMSTAGALRSRVFMELMTGQDLDNNQGNNPSDSAGHSAMLTASELKLIREWLDMGAQYFNNPKHASVPTN